MSHRPWPLLHFAVVYTADMALTLHGQPAAYHAGDCTVVVEANPLARPFLVLGPGWFLTTAAVWLAAVVFVSLRIRTRFVGWCVTVAAVAHSFGGAAWLARWEPAGWWLAVAYLVATTVMLEASRRGPRNPSRMPGQ